LLPLIRAAILRGTLLPLLKDSLFRGRKASAGFYIYTPFRSGKMNELISMLCRLLYSVSLVLIIIALSGPSMRNEKIRYLTEGDDYFFILDVSPSMSVNDLSGVRRVDAAKKMIRKFRKERGNDHPGLILFSDEAVLAVPPTPDFSWFDKIADNADIVYPDRGTALGDAVALAVFYLKKSSSDEKIAVLFSDGGSNTGRISPEAASVIAKESGVKIYTIALGRDLVDKGNFRPDVLKKIASDTGALYFHGNDTGEIEYALSFIGEMEKRERVSEKRVELESRAWFFMLLALIFAAVSVFVRTFVLNDIYP
jgi:Ca-activated chloride channel family protein